MGTAVELTHEALLTSVDLLEFAPVPGLQTAARTLLQIWDSLQSVDVRSFRAFSFMTFPLVFYMNVHLSLLGYSHSITGMSPRVLIVLLMILFHIPRNTL